MSMRADGWKLSVGLALGAGASHGWAHIGVLRALVAAGVVPDVIIGCSAGALVGAYYAADQLDVIEAWARGQTVTITMSHMRVRPGHSLFGASLFREMSDHFRDMSVEMLPVRFGAVATDLVLGTRRVLTEGSLSRAVAASGAFPLLFPPVKVDGSWLVDGCLTDPVPAELCLSLGVDIVIAVRLLDLGDFVAVRKELNAEAGQWRQILSDEEDTEPSPVPSRRFVATQLSALGRALGVDRAVGSLQRLASAACRGRDVPGLAAIALRSLAARERATRAMLRSARAADVSIAPQLGPLRLGPLATAQSIERGAEAVAGKTSDIYAIARAIAADRRAALRPLTALSPSLSCAY